MQSFTKHRQGLLTNLESFPKRPEYRRRPNTAKHNFSLTERPASCDVCGRESLIPYTVHVSNIIDASRAGCVSCLVICTALEHFKKPEAYATMVYIRFNKSHRPSIEILPGGDTGTECLMLEFFASDEELQHAPQKKTVRHPLPGILNMFSYPATTKIPRGTGLNMVRSLSGFWDSFKTSRDLVKSYSDPSAFKYVSQLLEECVKSHPFCRSTPGSPLPRRVIDVGLKSQGTDPDPVEHCRLYCSRGEYEKYITLSHCWGQAGTINTTTRENLEQQCNRIDWSSLSKTFKDAIFVTRALGIRYLWIDSLCIIQGDTADWEEESEKMGSIYEGSYITLAATASENGAGGLFVEHDTQAFDISLSKLTASAYGWRDAFVEALTIKGRRMLHHQPLSPGSAADPLTMRAWAYQERLLSARVLHYTSEELVWECKTSRKCECGGERFDAGSSKAQYEDMCRSYSPDCGEISSWHTLISVYTTLSLTYDKDKLPAFSGIAKQLVNNRHYLAGLRRESLILDLSWRTKPVREPGPHPSGQYRAPSWSWASLERPVTYERVISKSFLRADIFIHEAFCRPAATDIFGIISEGFLVLEGFTTEATLSQAENLNGGFATNICHSSCLQWVEIYLDHNFDTVSLKLQRVLLFVICVEFVAQGSVQITALALTESPHDDGSYMRIGIMKSSVIHKQEHKSWVEGELAGMSAYSLARQRVRIV